MEGKEKCVATRGIGGGGAGQAEGEGKDGYRQKMTMECGADGRAEEGVLGRLRLGAGRGAVVLPAWAGRRGRGGRGSCVCARRGEEGKGEKKRGGGGGGGER